MPSIVPLLRLNGEGDVYYHTSRALLHQLAHNPRLHQLLLLTPWEQLAVNRPDSLCHALGEFRTQLVDLDRTVEPPINI